MEEDIAPGENVIRLQHSSEAHKLVSSVKPKRLIAGKGKQEASEQ